MTETNAIVHADRSCQHTHTVKRSFAVRDAKGRSLGAFANCGTVVFVPAASEYCYYRVAPKDMGVTRFQFTPQATRDGEAFGACQSMKIFDTEAERDAAVAKYLAGAQKRALNVK